MKCSEREKKIHEKQQHFIFTSKKKSILSEQQRCSYIIIAHIEQKQHDSTERKTRNVNRTKMKWSMITD